MGRGSEGEARDDTKRKRFELQAFVSDWITIQKSWFPSIFDLIYHSRSEWKRREDRRGLQRRWKTPRPIGEPARSRDARRACLEAPKTRWEKPGSSRPARSQKAPNSRLRLVLCSANRRCRLDSKLGVKKRERTGNLESRTRSNTHRWPSICPLKPSRADILRCWLASPHRERLRLRRDQRRSHAARCRNESARSDGKCRLFSFRCGRICGKGSRWSRRHSKLRHWLLAEGSRCDGCWSALEMTRLGRPTLSGRWLVQNKHRRVAMG